MFRYCSTAKYRDTSADLRKKLWVLIENNNNNNNKSPKCRLKSKNSTEVWIDWTCVCVTIGDGIFNARIVGKFWAIKMDRWFGNFTIYLWCSSTLTILTEASLYHALLTHFGRMGKRFTLTYNDISMKPNTLGTENSLSDYHCSARSALCVRANSNKLQNIFCDVLVQLHGCCRSIRPTPYRYQVEKVEEQCLKLPWQGWETYETFCSLFTRYGWETCETFRSFLCRHENKNQIQRSAPTSAQKRFKR